MIRFKNQLLIVCTFLFIYTYVALIELYNRLIELFMMRHKDAEFGNFYYQIRRLGNCGRVMCAYTICRLAGCKEPPTYLGRYLHEKILSLRHSFESITSTLPPTYELGPISLRYALPYASTQPGAHSCRYSTIV